MTITNAATIRSAEDAQSLIDWYSNIELHKSRDVITRLNYYKMKKQEFINYE